MPKQIVHDAHKEHPLVFHDDGFRFRCDGCNCHGAGSRYRFAACDFDLHELCATCQPTAPFSFHGQHPLTFERAVFPEDPRRCDLCVAPIKGMHYRCRHGDFDVHPICSHLPGAAMSPLHPAHLLVLAMAASTKCTRCSTDCPWRYRCVPCEVELARTPSACLGPSRRR